MAPDKPPIYLLPSPSEGVSEKEPSSEEMQIILEEEKQLTTKDWDRRILYMVYKGKPWAEIARNVGRSSSYIKKIADLPEFQKELKELREGIGEAVVEQFLDSIKSAKEMRAVALQTLHIELLKGISQAKIASAKVLLDEAHREEMLNKGERERPLTLAEVRKMSVDDALEVTREHQMKRSGK